MQEKKQCRNTGDICCETAPLSLAALKKVNLLWLFDMGEVQGRLWRGARPRLGHDKHFSNAYHCNSQAKGAFLLPSFVIKQIFLLTECRFTTKKQRMRLVLEGEAGGIILAGASPSVNKGELRLWFPQALLCCNHRQNSPLQNIPQPQKYLRCPFPTSIQPFHPPPASP